MMMQNWMMTGPYGWGHWIFFVLMAVILLYPIGRILSRIGFSPFWSIVAFIPLINLVGLWVISLIDWPRNIDANQ